MIDSVSKPKPPKGLSYVLQTSQLEQALANAAIDCPVDLVYWIPQGGGSVLEGHYWLRNENVPYPRVYVRAGVVPSSHRAIASEALLAEGLPQFIDWLKEVHSLPDDSPALDGELYFNATFAEDRLLITNEPKYKARKRKR
jgi:hypothetical protein